LVGATDEKLISVAKHEEAQYDSKVRIIARYLRKQSRKIAISL